MYRQAFLFQPLLILPERDRVYMIAGRENIGKVFAALFSFTSRIALPNCI